MGSKLILTLAAGALMAIAVPAAESPEGPEQSAPMMMRPRRNGAEMPKVPFTEEQMKQLKELNEQIRTAANACREKPEQAQVDALKKRLNDRITFLVKTTSANIEQQRENTVNEQLKKLIAPRKNREMGRHGGYMKLLTKDELDQQKAIRSAIRESAGDKDTAKTQVAKLSALYKQISSRLQSELKAAGDDQEKTQSIQDAVARLNKMAEDLDKNPEKALESGRKGPQREKGKRQNRPNQD